MEKLAKHLYILCIFASCIKNNGAGNVYKQKRSPVANRPFLLASRTSSSDATTYVYDVNLPRQNVAAREQKSEIFSDISTDNMRRNLVIGKAGKDKEEIKNENINFNPNVSQNTTLFDQGYVYLNKYDNKNDALKNAIAISRYTGVDFTIDKIADDYFVVKTNKIDKKEAYDTMNKVVAVGYYSASILS